MTATGQRAARASLELARVAVEQVERASSPDDSAASLIEAWDSMEQSLQALAGTTALTGQALLRELRQRDLLSLAEAHTIIDFAAAAARARKPEYVLEARDTDLARAALDELAGVVDRGTAPARPTPASARPAAETPRTPVAGPTAQDPAPIPEVRGAPTGNRNLLGRFVVGGALVALVGGALLVAWAMNRQPSDLRRGRAAYASGDRATASAVFRAAAASHPELAEPHLYLGRIAREQGDMATANEELRRAVSLEPQNYLTHRELAALLLLNRRPDLARTFYERAIRLNPEDRTSLGYMGCTLLDLQRPDLAQRFLARAGAGPWNACTAPVPMPAPGGAPLAPPR